MGIDGFSMSNLGLNRNLTSAQLAHEVDATAKQALENQIADVDGVGKKEKAGRKDPDAAFNGMIPFIPDDEENNEQKQENPSEETPVIEKLVEKNEDESEGSQYHFKLNEEGFIEIWNSESNEIVKTISPENAANVMMGLSKLPGILVNKEV